MSQNEPLPPTPRLPVKPTLFKRGDAYYCHIRPPYWIRLCTGRESMRISLRTTDEATARIRLDLVADAYGVFFFVICTASVDTFAQIGFEDAYTEFRRYLGSELRFFYDGETC